MRIEPLALQAAAAIAAVAAGTLFAAIQFIHPPDELASVTTPAWALVAALTLAMAILGLAGVSGAYLRQARRSGVPGLAGFLLLAAFYLLTAMVMFVEALVLPVTAEEAPGITIDFIALAGGGEVTGDLGALTALGPLSGVLFMGGGVLFGVGLWRSRVQPRWVAVLIGLGALVPLATSFLPHELHRFAALPFALALIGLGLTWRPRRGRTDSSPRSEAAVV
ncbi:hypothetical protein ACFQS2_07765 [Brachybacterium sp. GCM10030267]|uniref:hypothetical protein n=1 Tax=unclassified Brachybacterium TaxID=2623841 RepID=UPI003620ACD7